MLGLDLTLGAVGRLRLRFVLCQLSVMCMPGSGSDSSWADSGIRLTVSKIWNMLYSSGVTGRSFTLRALIVELSPNHGPQPTLIITLILNITLMQVEPYNPR